MVCGMFAQQQQQQAAARAAGDDGGDGGGGDSGSGALGLDLDEWHAHRAPACARPTSRSGLPRYARARARRTRDRAIDPFAAPLRKDDDTPPLNIGTPPPKVGAPATTHAASTGALASSPTSGGGRRADVGCLSAPGTPRKKHGGGSE